MIDVAAAIIVNEKGQFLIGRRKKGKSQEGLWEFPGGKLEEGESVEDCLRRELREEMNIEIEPQEPYGVSEYDYGPFQVRLHACKAAFIRGEFRLTDHDEIRWASSRELGGCAFAPADLPFVARLEAEYGDGL